MEFQLSYFKSWKMMLWKCCTQCASTFGKLSSGHRTGKGQFSFQSQRKAMPKNDQTTAQLHSSHMLVKWCLKFSKPGFSNTWTINFQMFKLDLEKAEEPEIILPASTGSLKKQESPRKPSTSALLTMPNSLTVDHNKLWKILKVMGIPDHLPASWEICIYIYVCVHIYIYIYFFFFFGSKINAGGDCSHEIKRRLLLGWKVMTNLDSLLKSRYITLPKMVHLVKALVCPVVMYGCESWTIKKAECQIIDAFELWCWRRLLRVFSHGQQRYSASPC